MNIRTLVRYLVGDLEAILEIASNRHALWLGALFVLSAGFAREYDGQDLVHEPWHVLIPFGASIVSSFLLFSLCYLNVIAKDPSRPSFFSAYASFLGLFWITAPLAWLYAIPYERFLSPLGATQANLLTLGLVAAWRVALMVRVVSVLMGYTANSALVLVLCFADAVALLAVYLTPSPQVIAMMGGVRRTPAESLLVAAKFWVGALGICSLPIWGVSALVVVGSARASWQLSASLVKRPPMPARNLLILGSFSVAVWAAFLPLTQSEQLNRRRVEEEFKTGRIAEALHMMSAHASTDFPPQWDPPPHIGYADESPPLFEIFEIIAIDPPPPWVRTLYLEKLERSLEDSFLWFHLNDEQLSQLIRILRQLPEGRVLVEKHRFALERRLEHPTSSKEHEELKSELKSLLDATKKMPNNSQH